MIVPGKEERPQSGDDKARLHWKHEISICPLRPPNMVTRHPDHKERKGQRDKG